MTLTNKVMSRRFGLRSSSILTMSNQSREPVAGTVLVENGRIVDVSLGLETPVPDGWETLDVGNRTVLPGFVDPHIHIQMSSNALYGAVDCHNPPCSSISDVVEALRENLDKASERGGWLVGQGSLYADRRLSEGRMPTSADLDNVSTSVPVAVRFGGHVTVLNSLGLEMAFPDGPPNVPGSQIVLDESGRPNGITHELFDALPIPALSMEQAKAAMTETTRSLVTRFGITTIGEMPHNRRGLDVFAQLVRDSVIPQDVHIFLWTPATGDLESCLQGRDWLEFEESNPRLTVRGIKIFCDGGFSAAGAAVLRPYRGTHDGSTGHMGRLSYATEELVDLIERADDAGMQVTAHVNGERAQRQLCEAAILAHRSADSEPVRLEHAGNFISDWRTIDIWEEAGAVVVPQPPFIWSMGGFMPESLGDYANAGLFPFRDLLDKGVHVCSSSDGAGSDYLQFNPMFAVQCMLTRMSCLGTPVNPTQAITLLEALKMATLYAAESLGVADEVGSLEKGKRADILVADTNLASVAESKLSDVTFEEVFIGGVPIPEAHR